MAEENCMTVWRWCNDGKLLAFKVGRGWRIRRGEVERIVGWNRRAVEETREQSEVMRAKSNLTSLE